MTETYSPGLEGIVAGETAVSTVETGLSYRGYTIEDLAANSNYEEVCLSRPVRRIAHGS
jgi:2-methylcitrate synthase